MTVQQTIIKGIKELLFLHNYLVLPNFGGFVLKTGASHFSGSGLLLNPPAKTLSFNAQLKQNDSVLAIWLQNTMHCSPEEALTHLSDFAEFCSAILNTRRRLSLDGIGFFYLDFENNLSFEPQSDANFLRESFGFTPIQLHEIEVVPPIKPAAKVFVDRTPDELPQAPVAKPARNYKRLITPVVLSALLFSLLAIFVSNNKISGPLRASVFGHETRGVYQALSYPNLNLAASDKENTTYVADANGIATIKLNNKVVAVKAMEGFATNSVKKGVYHRTSSTHQFEIVLGCFTILENANKMAEKISQQHLVTTVSGRNDKGMYVVSSGSYKTKDDAVAGLALIRDKFPKAWIKQP